MPPTKRSRGQAAEPSSQTSKKRKMDDDAQKYYAVRAGHKPGVYLSWKETQEQTAGFKGATFKRFFDLKEAEDFVAGKKVAAASDAPTKFYAVANGNAPGIYNDWDTVSKLLVGAKAPKFKKFETRDEAAEYIRMYGDEAAIDAVLAKEPRSKKAKKSDALQTEPNVVHVYTDGSSRSNGTPRAVAGVGVFFGAGDPRNVSERLEGDASVQTNQRAELTAILRALEKVPVEQPMRIHTDSAYSINCVTLWYRGWERKDWVTTKGEDVINQDVIKAIRAIIDERTDAGTPTYFQKVKGHSTDSGNIAADKLAVAGAIEDD
ncbi:ribonuclease H [Xylariomycetidae sp. FL0641]|nr:ribonuclease H [Xylariomycetidae sp. FL0641]